MSVRAGRRALVLALVIALSAGASTAFADASTPSSGVGMLVLIDGCPGFVASGGLAPNANPPYPLSWTHNFSASWTQIAQLRFANDPSGQKSEFAISLRASGADTAGHRFAISGTLFWHLFASPELWADSGTVKIRRDDGGVISGSAVGDNFPIFFPIFSVDRALVVTANTCKLPS